MYNPETKHWNHILNSIQKAGNMKALFEKKARMPHSLNGDDFILEAPLPWWG